MLCPVDQSQLAMTTREGVEIDYCPKCRGVWLDRGELDKIIERTNAELATARTAPPGRRYDDDDDHKYADGKRRKKGGFFSELFD